MKPLFVFFAAFGLAAAQEPPEKGNINIMLKSEIEKVVADSKAMGFTLAMGPAVKGAPYSGVEVTETSQMLADGTRIHNEQQTNIWRDSEGRVRRETPDQVTIWNPVENISYVLDTKNQTGQKGTMNRFVMIRKAEGKAAAEVNAQGAVSRGTFTMRVDGRSGELPPFPPHELVVTSDVKPRTKLEVEQKTGKTESLGQQMVSGIPCEGTRTTTTIEAGAIGNDRPIQIISERWYSNELQTLVMTKRTDPRTGDETFRLTNVSRNEPPSTMFEVPSNYQIRGGKE